MADVTGLDDDIRTLYDRGLVSRSGAFEPEWVDTVREDIEAAFVDARAREGGALARGPERWYVEIHPEELRGFVDLVTHPWVAGICAGVLGPSYEIVELGFDIPFPGAADQPWHRDFPSEPAVYEQHRITSLAFNLTAVDMVPAMGAAEFAPGTQWEAGIDWVDGMFPPRADAPRYAERATRSYPQRGDISARSALTVHRGTANRSDSARPVLVLGVDAPGAGHGAKHDMQVTSSFQERLPEVVRRHLAARVVERLEPIVQKHAIAGLLSDEASGYEID
jgi:hypothetical protein